MSNDHSYRNSSRNSKDRCLNYTKTRENSNNLYYSYYDSSNSSNLDLSNHSTTKHENIESSYKKSQSKPK